MRGLLFAPKCVDVFLKMNTLKKHKDVEARRIKFFSSRNHRTTKLFGIIASHILLEPSFVMTRRTGVTNGLQTLLFHFFSSCRFSKFLCSGLVLRELSHSKNYFGDDSEGYMGPIMELASLRFEPTSSSKD